MAEDRKCSHERETPAPPDACAAGHKSEEDGLNEFLEQQALAERLGRIRHKILVMSGKGGVGKSTVAANMAISLSLAGQRVGLLDVDIHGPSIPKMLKLEDADVQVKDGTIQPVEKAGLKVMSIGFLLRDRDDAVIWRGPMKMGVIKQFLKDVSWGDLDYLVIDSPPGTGDEPLSVCQLAAPVDGAVIVTTPQDVATADVRKSITFCRQLSLPVLGVVENMSGFVCPKCGTVTDIFKAGGGERMAADMGVPFLGRIPIDPAVGEACGTGWINVFGATLPTNGPSGEIGFTYSFVHKNALFIGLDQYLTLHRVNQPWLSEQLATNRCPHVFVFGHEPAFKALHTDCLDDCPTARDAFWTSLADSGAALYLTGHAHFYDHLRLDDGDGNPSNDLHQIIAGTAGGPLYSFNGIYDGDNGQWTPTGVCHDKAYGYVVVNVDEKTVTMTWKRRSTTNVFVTADVFAYSADQFSPSHYVSPAGSNIWPYLRWETAATDTSLFIPRPTRTATA